MIQKEIHCEKEDTLRTLLTREEIVNIQNITITGNVSTDDFRVLSVMAKDHALTEIDMSNAFRRIGQKGGCKFLKFYC